MVLVKKWKKTDNTAHQIYGKILLNLANRKSNIL